MSESTGQVTQEKLLELLFSQAQHNATREELAESEARLRAEIAGVKTELRAEIAEVRTEITDVKKELKGDIGKLDTKLDRILWFMIATMVTALGATLGLLLNYFLP